MAVESPSGYFMAFDGNTGGEPNICFGRSQADAPEQPDAAREKTKPGPTSKGKASQRAVRPRQIRRSPKSAAKIEDEESNPLPEESDQSVAQRPPAGSLARTKRLIMAALRVWELKQGIRD